MNKARTNKYTGYAKIEADSVTPLKFKIVIKITNTIAIPTL